MRAVIDTNVLVSAVILPTSHVGAVILYMGMGAFTPLYCVEMLEELTNVLARPRIRKKYDISPQYIRNVLDLILLRGQLIEPSERVTVCRDPKDDIFLSVALAGEADVLVTGDEDLLTLHPFRSISIVRPPTFLANLQNV